MSHGLGARRLKVVLGLATLTVGMLGGTLALFEPAAHASDNPDCPAGTVEYKVASNPINGLTDGQTAQFTVNGQTFTFTKVVGPSPFEDDSFDFTSTIAVSVVYVKGGVGTNVYDFVPPATVGTGMHPPLNSGNQPPTISHVSFCASSDTTTTTAATTTTTVPETSTTVADTTTTTVPETSTTVADTTTTVPETSTTVADTTTTVPETTTTLVEQGTTTTVPETSTTVGDTTTTVPETTTTVGDTTTTLPGTTTTVTVVNEGTTVASSTTVPKSTTTEVEQGAVIPTTTTPVAATDLPFTGSNSSGAAMFGLSCVAAGTLLLIRKRRNWSAS